MFSNDFLNGLQAAFLRPGALPDPDAPGCPNPPLAAELAELSEEELDKRCRANGLSPAGGRPAKIGRLLALDAYLNADRVAPAAAAAPLVPATAQAAAAALEAQLPLAGNAPGMGATAVPGDGALAAGVAAGSAAAAPPPRPTSVWETVDDDADRQQRLQVGCGLLFPLLGVRRSVRISWCGYLRNPSFACAFLSAGFQVHRREYSLPWAMQKRDEGQVARTVMRLNPYVKIPFPLSGTGVQVAVGRGAGAAARRGAAAAGGAGGRRGGCGGCQRSGGP